MDYPILTHIAGLDPTYNRHTEIVHYAKHFARDLSGVPTPDAYLELAQALGRSAAVGEPGTYVKPRGNGDLAVYVDTPLSRLHSYNHGIFMVVRSRGSYGLVATMFAPDEGKVYFDVNEERNRNLI
jgi:hypothetical protein